MKKTSKDDVVLVPPWELGKTILAKNIATVLQKHYPDHRWAIGIPDIGGGIIIRNLNIPTMFSIFIRPQDLDEPSYKIVVRMAGQMLEAFQLRRGRFILDQCENLDKGKGGLIMPDHNALPTKNLSRQIKAKMP